MANQRLKIGDVVPDFEMTDLAGETVKLSDLKGQKVFLSFYRFATCPLSNFRVAQAMREHKHFGQEVTFVGVFESSDKYLEKYVKPRQLPFRVIADPKANLYRAYGVEASWFSTLKGFARVTDVFKALFSSGYKPGMLHGSISRVPADILIDEGGTVLAAHYGKDIIDHMPFEELRAYLDQSSALVQPRLRVVEL